MLNHQKSNLYPKSRPQASEEEIEHNANLLFQQIESQLILSDVKAYLTILTNAFLLILLTFAEAQHLHHALQSSLSLPQRLSSLAILLVFLSLLSSSFYALRTLLPTLQDRDRITLMYFGHIAELAHEKFVSNFQHQPLRELKESLLSEVYVKSRIARRKLSFGTRSISLFFLALLFWLLAQFLLLLYT